jgi:DNA-binding MarR family transcriptional regulator
MYHRKEPDSLDFCLVQVCQLHYTRAHALLDDLGLYRGQPPVLRALWEEDGLTHSELADRLHVQPATITKMITRMEKNGFVERRQDLEDQRVWRVHITEAGRDIRDRVEQIHRQMEAETFAGLDAEERSTLRRFLARVRENLLRVTEERPPR